MSRRRAPERARCIFVLSTTCQHVHFSDLDTARIPAQSAEIATSRELAIAPSLKHSRPLPSELPRLQPRFLWHRSQSLPHPLSVEPVGSSICRQAPCRACRCSLVFHISCNTAATHCVNEDRTCHKSSRAPTVTLQRFQRRSA